MKKKEGPTDSGLSCKGPLQQADTFEVWAGPERNDGMSEVDTG